MKAVDARPQHRQGRGARPRRRVGLGQERHHVLGPPAGGPARSHRGGSKCLTASRSWTCPKKLRELRGDRITMVFQQPNSSPARATAPGTRSPRSTRHERMRKAEARRAGGGDAAKGRHRDPGHQARAYPPAVGGMAQRHDPHGPGLPPAAPHRRRAHHRPRRHHPGPDPRADEGPPARVQDGHHPHHAQHRRGGRDGRRRRRHVRRPPRRARRRQRPLQKSQAPYTGPLGSVPGSAGARTNCR